MRRCVDCAVVLASTRSLRCDDCRRIHRNARPSGPSPKQGAGTCPSCGQPCYLGTKLCMKCKSKRKLLNRRLATIGRLERQLVGERGRIERLRGKLKRCRECDRWFLPAHGKSLSCSEDCRRSALRSVRREAKHRRRARAGGKRVVFSRVCIRDGWKCQICGDRVDPSLEVPHPLAKTRDHIIPLSEGGEHIETNVRLAHFICNSQRGARGGGEQLFLL